MELWNFFIHPYYSACNTMLSDCGMNFFIFLCVSIDLFIKLKFKHCCVKELNMIMIILIIFLSVNIKGKQQLIKPNLHTYGIT